MRTAEHACIHQTELTTDLTHQGTPIPSPPPAQSPSTTSTSPLYTYTPLAQMAAGYQPLIHAGVVRQAAEMRSIAGGEALRTGSREFSGFCCAWVCLVWCCVVPTYQRKNTHQHTPTHQPTHTQKTGSNVTFHFLYYAEYLVVGSTFLFREGRAKGIGKVVELLHNYQHPTPSPAPASVAVGAGVPQQQQPLAVAGGQGAQQQQQLN